MAVLVGSYLVAERQTIAVGRRPAFCFPPDHLPARPADTFRSPTTLSQEFRQGGIEGLAAMRAISRASCAAETRVRNCVWGRGAIDPVSAIVTLSARSPRTRQWPSPECLHDRGGNARTAGDTG